MVVRQSNNGRVKPFVTYQWWKGVIDRVLALLVIAVLWPLLVLIAIAIRLDSPGSALFRQERVGKGGRRFIVYKFRTMHANNDDSAFQAYMRRNMLEGAACHVDEKGQPVYKFTNDPRVTRFGDLLRKTNLDEIPQVFNVLKGEMSFVGPRPEMIEAFELYSEWHRERLAVTPGITGLWQVYGRRKVSFDDMVRFDIDYIQRQSPLLDAKIMLLTPRVLLMRDGS